MTTQITQDDVLLLVRLGAEGGGRVDPARILARSPEAHSRRSFMQGLKDGFFDDAGHVTDAGYEALRRWRDQ